MSRMSQRCTDHYCNCLRCLKSRLTPEQRAANERVQAIHSQTREVSDPILNKQTFRMIYPDLWKG